MSIRTAFAVRGEFLISTLALLVQLAVVPAVWRALYAGQGQIAGITPATAVGYAVLAVILLDAMNPWHFSSLPDRVRQGTIAIDIVRPVGLIDQVVAQQWGNLIAALPRAVIGIAFAATTGVLPLPPDAVAAAGFLLSVLLGATIAVLLNLLVGMTAFWTIEVSGITMIYRMVAALSTGALVPFWFMPSWLATVLGFLPFKQQIFTPLSIYLGQFDRSQALVAFGAQLLWIGLLCAAAMLVWSRAFRKVVVSGG